jgi:hypothetical protein
VTFLLESFVFPMRASSDSSRFRMPCARQAKEAHNLEESSYKIKSHEERKQGDGATAGVLNPGQTVKMLRESVRLKEFPGTPSMECVR